MKNTQGFILFLLTLFLLNSCCQKSVCDCWENWYDAIGFQFVKAPLEGGFTDDEIDTLRLYRLDTNQVVLDSLELYKDTANIDEYVSFDSTRYLLILGGWLGIYGTHNKIDITQNDFRIKLLDGTVFDITDIEIENETYKVNKCCDCPRNLKKTLKVNGLNYDLSGKQELNEIPILLKR